jgi:hypothetical protein
MIFRRAVLTVLLVFVTETISSAQGPVSPDSIINFGGLRVPACAVSTDAEYGLTAKKPIQLGGGPSFADSRLTRFLGALRGPNGETLKIAPGRGSMMAPFGYMDEPVILDNYQISVGDGGQKMSLYVDDYHYGIPKAPMSFTCAGPLVVALGPPPLDPMLLNRNLVHLAIEKGSAQEIPPVPLDVSTPRGFLFDQFAMIAHRARAAANAGTPMDPAKPPTGLDPAGLVAVAVPMPCGDKTLTPLRIELSSPQGPIPQNGTLITDEAAVKMFPLLKVPAGSIAARFRPAQISGIKIVYSEGCNATPAEVSLLVRVDVPRAPIRPTPMPAGIVEAEPAVFLQTILDPLGDFSSIAYVGGPKSLLPAATEAMRQVKTGPVRLNGVGIANAGIISYPFQTP